MIFKTKDDYVAPRVQVVTISMSTPLCGSWQKDPVIDPDDENDLGEY